MCPNMLRPRLEKSSFLIQWREGKIKNYRLAADIMQSFVSIYFVTLSIFHLYT